MSRVGRGMSAGIDDACKSSRGVLAQTPLAQDLRKVYPQAMQSEDIRCTACTADTRFDEICEPQADRLGKPVVS